MQAVPAFLWLGSGPNENQMSSDWFDVHTVDNIQKAVAKIFSPELRLGVLKCIASYCPSVAPQLTAKVVRLPRSASVLCLAIQQSITLAAGLLESAISQK